MIQDILDFSGEFRAASIKYFNGRGGEGFECVLLRKGRVIGTALDEGNGGQLRLDIPAAMDRKALEEQAKVKLPTTTSEVEQMYVSWLVGYWNTLKSLKTKAKKKILVVDPADKTVVDENGITQRYFTYSGENTAAARAEVQAKNPAYIILNDLLDQIDVAPVSLKRR